MALINVRTRQNQFHQAQVPLPDGVEAGALVGELSEGLSIGGVTGKEQSPLTSPSLQSTVPPPGGS